MSSFTCRSIRIFVTFSTNYTFVNRSNTYLFESHIITNHWQVLISKESRSPISSHDVITTTITGRNFHAFSHIVIVTYTSRTSSSILNSLTYRLFLSYIRNDIQQITHTKSSVQIRKENT